MDLFQILALMVHPGAAATDVIVVMTYVVVVFSVAVQGLTLGALVRRLASSADRDVGD